MTYTLSVIASLRGSEPIVTPLELLDLSNPKGFAEWFDTHVHVFGYSIQELSQRVAAIGTPLASFRAGSMLIASTGLGEWVEQAKAHFARALESNDTVLQCFAMIRLTGLETRTSLHGLSRFATGTQGVVPLLEHQLNRLERLESKSAFALEAISKAHQGLGDAHMLSGDYAKADLHFLLAIELSEALGLKSAAERNRAWHSTTLFAAGRVKHSLSALQNVIATSSNPTYIEAAVHGYAVALLELGEDETALSWLEHHEVCPGLKTLALAWTGRGGEDPLVSEHLDELGPESAVNLECLNVLLRNHGQPAAHDLHGVSSIVRKSKEEAPFWRAYTAFFQSLSALRLGEVQLAATHFEDIPDVLEEHLALRVLRLGLALEIGLHLHGEVVIPLAEAAQSLADLFTELSRTAQFALARRFSIYLPLAGAFMAFSPCSNRAFVAASGQAVMKLIGRATVNGKFLQPLHAGVFSLRAFGLDVEYRPNQRQREEEREATLLPVSGGRLHRFVPLAPAFLILKYWQVFETSGDPRWQRSALALANSHGVLPAAKGFEVERRKDLEHALNRLLESQIDTAEVMRLVRRL